MSLINSHGPRDDYRKNPHEVYKDPHLNRRTEEPRDPLQKLPTIRSSASRANTLTQLKALGLLFLLNAPSPPTTPRFVAAQPQGQGPAGEPTVQIPHHRTSASSGNATAVYHQPSMPCSPENAGNTEMVLDHVTTSSSRKPMGKKGNHRTSHQPILKVPSDSVKIVKPIDSKHGKTYLGSIVDLITQAATSLRSRDPFVFPQASAQTTPNKLPGLDTFNPNNLGPGGEYLAEKLSEGIDKIQCVRRKKTREG